MYGYITKGNTQVSFYITVSGYPHRGYLYYELEEAKAAYCEEFGIDIEQVNFDDWRKY